MKLLMESWRKYLNEGEETHFPWLEDLKQRGKEALMGDNFEKIGSGAFRIVFQPKGDEDHVVKLSKESGNNWMNKVEMKTGNFYPSIFPKTFAHADDWGWIVQEAVNVLTPKNQEAHLGDVLYKTFPEISVDFGSREELSEPIELWDLITRALFNPVSSDEIELQAYGLENEKAFREHNRGSIFLSSLSPNTPKSIATFIIYSIRKKTEASRICSLCYVLRGL